MMDGMKDTMMAGEQEKREIKKISKIMVISDYALENKEREIFDRLIKAVGICESDVCVSHIFQHEKNKRAPSVAEIMGCLPTIIEDVNLIKPEIIVLAGNTPLYLFTHKRGISKNRGFQINTGWIGNGFTVEQVYATLHPASLSYGSTEQIKMKRQWLWNDWQEISRTLSVIKKEEEVSG